MVKTEEKAKQEWLKWLKGYDASKFYDAFVKVAQGAEGTCEYCDQPIYLDIVEGGGIPDWKTADGDYGCNKSPETCEEGTGSHSARKLAE